MAKIKKDNSAGGIYHIDDGAYKAIIEDIEEGKSQNKRPGQSGTFLRWKFKIIDPLLDDEEVGEEVILSGITPDIATDKNRLGDWLKACGSDMDDGDSMDTDELCGTKVRVIVKTKANDKDPDKEYCNVVDVLRLKKKKKKKKDDDDDDDVEEKKSKKNKEEKKDKEEKKSKKDKEEKKSKNKDEDESPPDDDDDDDSDLWDDLDDGDDDD